MVVNPLGLAVVGQAALQIVVGYWQRATIPGGLLGLGLLGLAVRGLLRSNRPMLLTSCREGLHLEPTDSRYRVFLQFHLRLELADGRVVHLANQPGARPADLAGTVQLDVVARKLPRWAKPGPHRRPLFHLTRPARILLWGSWVAIATAVGLLAERPSRRLIGGLAGNNQCA